MKKLLVLSIIFLASCSNETTKSVYDLTLHEKSMKLKSEVDKCSKLTFNKQAEKCKFGE